MSRLTFEDRIRILQRYPIGTVVQAYDDQHFIGTVQGYRLTMHDDVELELKIAESPMIEMCVTYVRESRCKKLTNLEL